MILTHEKLPALLEKLSATATVYVPTVVDEISCLAPYKSGDSVEFGKAKTDIPAKELLFPQTETLYTYSKLGEDITIEETVNETNQILFGLRSCDTYSIERLDEVFLTRGFVDTPYYERRRNTLIVSLDCTEPDRSCFCTSLGIDPSRAEGTDIQLTRTEKGFFVEALTDKGKEELTQWREFLDEGESPEHNKVDCSLTLDLGNIEESLKDVFDDPYWDDLSMKCLNCGTCAYLCPTCHCFDISQTNQGSTGYRFRTWDSCMFTDYTLMAGNHNPRPTKKERLRNRFMHKLSFYYDRYGSSMCCGCGRCIEMCPAGIDISRIIEDVREVVSND